MLKITHRDAGVQGRQTDRRDELSRRAVYGLEAGGRNLFREETFTETKFVTETAEREEEFTDHRPVVETSFHEQQYTVQRPVVETQYVDQQFTVQRPVVETQNRLSSSRQCVPSRPCKTKPLMPAASSHNKWYTRAGSVLTQAQSSWLWDISGHRNKPQTVQTQLMHRPNLITQQVAQTSFVPEVQQVQVPVQVQRMQTEVVSQRVPVQVQRMQSEVVTQKVPVQTTRMVATTQVRKIPYTVQRPITETKTRKVPVQQQRWVSEERVRKVPVQTTRTVYETRSEPIEVQYYEQEEVKANGDATGDSSGLRTLHRNLHGSTTDGATNAFVLRRSVQPGDRFWVFVVLRSSSSSSLPVQFIVELSGAVIVRSRTNWIDSAIEPPAFDDDAANPTAKGRDW